MDTHVYIDGFNLYYGLLKGTPYKWLDLERFCDQLLPRNTVRKIYYFTAKVDARPNDPDQPTRQQAYLNALAASPRVEIHLGTFMSLIVSQVSGVKPSSVSDPLATLRMSAHGNEFDLVAGFMSLVQLRLP